MTTAKKAPQTAVVRKLTRPRRVASGDVAPDDSDKSFEDFAVQEKIAAARESKAVAVKDIIEHLSGKNTGALPESLQAIFDGASHDDALALRKALLELHSDTASKTTKITHVSNSADEPFACFHKSKPGS